MDIIKDLESNGWKINQLDDQMIFATRKLTGKTAFFIEKNTLNEIGEIEAIRVWTKKGIHPFVYFEKQGKLFYYDLLFDELVRRP